ncbi:MAG: hypothetical protein ABJD24_15170 [Acidimicrobiales bacterium]
MEELPVEVVHGSSATGEVVALGPRRPGVVFIVAALVVVVTLAVVVGSHRPSPPDHGTSAFSTLAPGTTATASSTSVAGPTTTAAPAFPAVPSLAGYRLRGVLGDGTVFGVDIETGRIQSWTQLPGRAGGVEGLTPESFIVRQPDRSLVVSFDPDAPVLVVSPPGRLIPSDTGFAVLATANGQRSLALFGAKGEETGTLEAAPWAESISVAGLTADQIILEGLGVIYHVPYQPTGSSAPLTVGTAEVLASGEVISVGSGRVAYRSCDAKLDCLLRFRSASGGREITTRLVADEIDSGVARFTPDGKTFITATRRGDGSKQITLVDTTTAQASTLPSGDQSFRGVDNISVTADSGVLVWQFDDHRFAFRDLRDQTAAVVELPVPALYVTLTPKGL